jgi:CheY-like chemotaxis protein
MMQRYMAPDGGPAARPARSGPIVAAIINTSHDVIDMLRLALQQAGIVPVTAFTHQVRDGEIDLDAFMRQHEPSVIVYDLAPPYDANIRLFQHLSGLPSMQGRQFVLTSVNTAQVEKLLGTDDEVYEVVGKPLDLGKNVRAEKEAGRSRPTR